MEWTVREQAWLGKIKCSRFLNSFFGVYVHVSIHHLEYVALERNFNIIVILAYVTNILMQSTLKLKML